MKTISSFSSKLLALGLVFLSVISTYAYDFQSGDLSYTITSDAEPYTVSVARAFQQDIGIPKDTITKVVIPATVTHEDITYSVTSVAGYAFSSCSFLTTVKIPESIVTIGMSAFEGCIFAKDNFINHSSLDAKLYRYWGAIIVDQEIDGLLIRNDTIIDCRTNVTSVVIPNTITAIGKEAFFACHLLSVTIPSSVTSIGDYAFLNCALPSVTIPTSVTSIGNYAFSMCALSSITIPNSITSISNNVFADCKSLQQVTIPNSVTSIGNCAFQNCTSLSSFTIPGSVSSIGFNAFYNTAFYNNESNWNNGLYKDNCFIEAAVDISGVYTIKDGTRLIADVAFCHKSMTSVVIPNSVKVIGKGAFSRSSSLESVIIPNGVEFLADEVFSGCTSLTSVTLPESIISIGKDAFNLCTSLTSISLPNSIADIGTYAFSYCTSLANISIPDKIKSIQQYTFRNCESLTSVCIPNSVTDIKEGAFTRCSALTSITIPSSVTNIDETAFYWCDALDSVTCYAITPPTLHQWAFQYYNATLYVPAESVETYKATDQWKNFTQILPIAENPEDLFPTLWGLQRTHTIEMYDYAPNDGKRNGGYPELTAPTKDTIIDGKTYLQFDEYYSSLFLREENNKVLIYSSMLQEDLVLYDYTLGVGDSLHAITGDDWFSDANFAKLDKAKDIFTYVVTEVSTITLIDGIERKKWTLQNQYLGIMEYVEGIGCFGEKNSHSGDFFRLIYNHPYETESIGNLLVCVSKNGQLLYSMSQEEMDGFTLTCKCLSQSSYKDQWCDQWNILSHGYQGPQDPLAAACTSIFWLSNNTVNRDGQEYIPLMCSSSRPDVESTNLIGELRFTEDKQVYFYYDNTEYLLYDFDVQVGDTLDIFGGIELYSYSFVEQKTYPHVITKIDTLDDGRLQITSDAIVIFEDGEVGTFEEKQQQIWIEGLGSTNGIVYTSINPGIAGDAAIVMLCAYRDDECVYKTDSNDPYWIDYTQLGCVYNEGDFIEGAFPILSGLQRTVYDEFCGEAEIGAVYTGKQTFDKIFFENNKPYILCNDYLLREEDNKILIYSQLLNKDLVLYDFTLEVGDSLPALYIDYHARNAMDWIPYNPDVVDYNIDFDGTIYPADTFVVTDISNVTLLDGKEYKKWTFDNGMEYVEGIGMYGGHRNGNFFGLIQEVVVPCHIGTHLVCVSKNNKLLYQMDDAEMERLGAECLCDYDSGHRKDNAKDGQIGGRPTPTQWNQLEVVLREMDNNHTILQAETFSYTLEDISQQVNNKTYFQLARQSTKDTATTKSVVGALHFGKDEDNRVYFLRDGVEYVLYDFTAEPGDTVEIFAGINNYPQETTYTHVVTGKDTLENGACRMLLEVVFPDDTNATAENAEKVWLAGLGSVDGIVHNAAKRTSNAHAAPSRTAHSSDTQTSVMLCAWREDSCLYTTDHPDYDSFGCVYNQDPTSVENTHSPLPIADYQKLLRNGQLLIIHNGKTYNVLGIAVE